MRKWGMEKNEGKDAKFYYASRVANAVVAEELHQKTRFWN